MNRVPVGNRWESLMFGFVPSEVRTPPLAPASRFTADRIPPGTLLKRFDGAVFRVRQLLPEKGLVELEGVREPYSEFRKIEELRFQFSPPE